MVYLTYKNIRSEWEGRGGGGSASQAVNSIRLWEGQSVGEVQTENEHQRLNG